ncbi:hypothetical protein LTR41_010940 [Exophiala xenobiotica]|nr:hypothetical protein LTR41_010940 [Exophiala xenobiotica]KAK5551108.1 hypothetical protein LTR46_010861 [Exophiala xenobiotica]
MAEVFDSVFNAEQRLDFVFANAGVIEKVDFYENNYVTGSSPELDQFVVVVNLQSVFNTTYFAQQYFPQMSGRQPAKSCHDGKRGFALSHLLDSHVLCGEA